MFNNDLFSDVIFRFKKTQTIIFCHRMALAAQSAVFNAMFTSGILEASESGKDIDIDYTEAEEEVFSIMIHYMYTGYVECTTAQLIPLLQMAHKVLFSILLFCYFFNNFCLTFIQYDVIELKDRLADYMLVNLDAENCLEYFLATHTIEEGNNLREAAANKVAEKFQEISESKTFNKLDTEMLMDFIKRDDLVVDGEHVILDAVLNWISMDRYEREEFFNELAACIRWEYVKIESLAIATSTGWIRENKAALQLLNDVLIAKCAKLQNVELKRRNSTSSNPMRKYRIEIPLSISASSSPVKQTSPPSTSSSPTAQNSLQLPQPPPLEVSTPIDVSETQQVDKTNNTEPVNLVERFQTHAQEQQQVQNTETEEIEEEAPIAVNEETIQSNEIIADEEPQYKQPLYDPYLNVQTLQDDDYSALIHSEEEEEE